MELRINDYVRTDTGIIEKLEGIHKQNKTNDTIIKLNKMGEGRYAHILDINSEFAEEFDKDFSRGNIIKSSPNIIDLLKPMDLIYVDIDNDYAGGIIVPRIAETYCELKQIINEIKLGNYILKGVVTKEQIENCMYKVGD